MFLKSPYVYRLPKRKAVSIGVGLQCQNAVVLCADRQITVDGGLKLEEQKVHSAHVQIDKVVAKVAFTYVGDPVASKNLFEEMYRALPAAKLVINPSKMIFLFDAVKAVMEQVCKDKKYRNVETLFAISFPPNVSAFMMRTRGATVSRGLRECMGVGHSSVVQYFSDLLSNPVMSEAEAKAFGIYLVLLANRYADGCSGGPDCVVVKGEEIEQVTQEQMKEYRTKLDALDQSLKNTLISVIREFRS